MSLSDEIWMEEALREAQRALAMGEVPVGAVLIQRGRIVGRGFNCPLTTNDPTAHAEVLALREAGKAIGNYRLLDCDLYVTVEIAIKQTIVADGFSSFAQRKYFSMRCRIVGCEGAVESAAHDSSALYEDCPDGNFTHRQGT